MSLNRSASSTYSAAVSWNAVLEYAGTASLQVPSRRWMGWPATLPLMSHRQMSIAPIAAIDAWRFIFQSRCHSRPMSCGSWPMTTGLR